MASQSEVVAAVAAYGSDPSETHLVTFLNAIGAADGYMLSDGGSPLAPNPRIVTGKDRRKWIAAYSSIELAARAKPVDDGIIRAPFPLICAAARAPGISGIILNPGDDSASLIEGRSLRTIAAMPGSLHPIAMIDPNYAATLLVRVTDSGDLEVEGRPGTIEALRGELVALKAQRGIVQYTRDSPSSEPTDKTASTMRLVLDLVAELKLPVSFVELASHDQVQAARAEGQAQAEPRWRRFLRRP